MVSILCEFFASHFAELRCRLCHPPQLASEAEIPAGRDVSMRDTLQNTPLYPDQVRSRMRKRASRPFRIRARSALFLLPAWFSPASSLRAAFHRLRGARIAKTAEIGYFVILDNLYPEKITIAEAATVSARSTILSHDESKAYTGRGPEIVAETRIGTGAFIGVQCVILPGVIVGEGAIVGAGSVVTRNVPPGVTVAGVPAKVIHPPSQGAANG